jgi:hypothetical protein
MQCVVKIAAKFILSLTVMTVICTLAWDVVGEQLYDCTDPVGFDYLQPGNWVHGDVVVVDHVIHHRSMSEPDTIKAGWSVGRLWILWFLFIVFSIVISVRLSFVTWISRR